MTLAEWLAKRGARIDELDVLVDAHDTYWAPPAFSELTVEGQGNIAWARENLEYGRDYTYLEDVDGLVFWLDRDGYSTSRRVRKAMKVCEPWRRIDFCVVDDDFFLTWRRALLSAAWKSRARGCFGFTKALLTELGVPRHARDVMARTACATRSDELWRIFQRFPGGVMMEIAEDTHEVEVDFNIEQVAPTTVREARVAEAILSSLTPYDIVGPPDIDFTRDDGAYFAVWSSFGVTVDEEGRVSYLTGNDHLQLYALLSANKGPYR